MSITYAIEKSYKKEDKSLSKIFKPRRGTENTMKTVKSNTVLAAGELFAELPNTGAGTGKGRLVMGDGVTAYGNLPSFVENTDVSTAQVTVTADNSATSTAAINNVSSGATTGALIGSLKQAISLTKSELSNTIDDYVSTNNVKFYFDYQDGEYGYNTSPLRGADTFSPFKKGSLENLQIETNTRVAVNPNGTCTIQLIKDNLYQIYLTENNIDRSYTFISFTGSLIPKNGIGVGSTSSVRFTVFISETGTATLRNNYPYRSTFVLYRYYIE